MVNSDEENVSYLAGNGMMMAMMMMGNKESKRERVSETVREGGHNVYIKSKTEINGCKINK